MLASNPPTRETTKNGFKEIIVNSGAANNGEICVHVPNFLADRRKPPRGVAPGPHQQSARPSVCLRKRKVHVGFVQFAEIHAADVARDTNHFTARNEGVLLTWV